MLDLSAYAPDMSFDFVSSSQQLSAVIKEIIAENVFPSRLLLLYTIIAVVRWRIASHKHIIPKPATLVLLRRLKLVVVLNLRRQTALGLRLLSILAQSHPTSSSSWKCLSSLKSYWISVKHLGHAVHNIRTTIYVVGVVLRIRVATTKRCEGFGVTCRWCAGPEIDALSVSVCKIGKFLYLKIFGAQI